MAGGVRDGQRLCWIGLALVLAGCSGDGSGGPGEDDQGAASCEAAERSGEGTYYDADGSGNCSFEPSPDDLMVAAMNEIDYAGSAACGACVSIEGPLGEVTVRIVDRCPECPEGDIDLSTQAFEHIAELSAGRVPITWRYVACEVSGPMQYHFKDGSSQYWTAIQVRNHRHRVASLEVLGDGGYRSVERLEYNYFVAADGLGEGPYDLRITDVHGNVVEDTGIAVGDAVLRSGTSQLPECR